MAEPNAGKTEAPISRDRLAELLNEDLARECQAIIGYVVCSQVMKGARFMSVAGRLEGRARDELKHALIISRQIDHLGKAPCVAPNAVRISGRARDIPRLDLDNETIRNYRERVRQCEALGEFAMAARIRQILVDEQDRQIDPETALAEDVPDHSRLEKATPPGQGALSRRGPIEQIPSLARGRAPRQM